MEPLRLAVVLPGAISLGAYEAGAATALVETVRAHRGDIVVDTIVGASAGSITGLLLASQLLRRDSNDLWKLWVDQADISNLLIRDRRAERPRAPLATQQLETFIGALFTEPTAALQCEPIYLVMSIANLRGLRYRIFSRSTQRTVEANTYRDARVFHLESTAGDWQQALDTAVASGAHAAAFPAVRLSRRRSEYPSSIEFPAQTEANFWYTDGGTVYNQPLGFALDAVFSPEELKLPARRSTGKRLFLIIHPSPDTAPDEWPPHGAKPSFGSTAARAWSMMRSQSLYDDLRALEKMNSRLFWRQQVAAVLAKASKDDPLRADLEDLGRKAVAEKQLIRAALHRPEKGEVDVLDTLLDSLSGVSGRDAADVHLLGPPANARPLAGSGLGHFFGFWSRTARQSDYDRGAEDFAAWVAAMGFGSVQVSATLAPRSRLPRFFGRLMRYFQAVRVTYRYGREMLVFLSSGLRGFFGARAP